MLKLSLISLKNVSIHDQLILEEKLLRSDTRNICLINHGSPKTLVMGISGKKEELIDIALAKKENVPLLKRFSGGGTVVIDEDTLFVTFICNEKEAGFEAFPEKIHRWATHIYEEVFFGHPFSFKENDYRIGDKKCGGNAQYIKKERWLHHTSFLWDYQKENMDLLLMPKKQPEYRKKRPHTDFLCTLKEFFLTKEAFIDRIIHSLSSRFDLTEMDLEELKSLSESRISTEEIAL